MLSRLQAIATFGVVILATVLAFPGLPGGTEVPLFRDLLFYFLPLKQILAEAFTEGAIPFWNPRLLLGVPYFASLQTAIFYPPSALLALPFPLGFDLFLLAHYAIAASGSVAWLRDRRLGPFAVAIGALSFTLGGFLVALFNVTNHLQAAVWAPWILFFADRATRSALGWVGLGLVTAGSVLAGSPEMLALSLVAALLQTIWRSGVGPTIRVGVAIGVGLGLVAFQILSTMELTRLSTRGHAMAFESVAYWSLQPLSLLQILFPHSSSLLSTDQAGGMGAHLERVTPWLTTIYPGLVALLFAVAGSVVARERWLWNGMLLGGLVLSLGANTPVFGWLYAAVPEIVGRFRYPEKFFLLVAIPFTVLVAEGVQAILEGNERARRALFTTAAGLVGVAIGFRLLRTISVLDYCSAVSILRAEPTMSLEACSILGSDLVFKAERAAAFLVLVSGAVVLARREILSAAAAGLVFVLLAASDLVSVNRNHSLTISWDELQRAELALDPALVRESGLRVFAYQNHVLYDPARPPMPIPGFVDSVKELPITIAEKRSYQLWQTLLGNTPASHGLAAYGGLEAMAPATIEFLRKALEATPRELTLGVLRAHSVGWLVGEERLALPGLTALPARGESGFHAYRIDGALPRARLVARLRAGATDLEAYNAMISRSFDPALEAVAAALPPGWTDGEGDPGTAAIVEEGWNRVVVEISARRPAFLVLADGFFPGWSATIDGEAAPIVKTNVLTRGVAVPAGEHRIAFEFEPTWLRRGVALSILAAAILLAGGVWLRRAERVS